MTQIRPQHKPPMQHKPHPLHPFCQKNNIRQGWWPQNGARRRIGSGPNPMTSRIDGTHRIRVQNPTLPESLRRSHSGKLGKQETRHSRRKKSSRRIPQKIRTGSKDRGHRNTRYAQNRPRSLKQLKDPHHNPQQGLKRHAKQTHRPDTKQTDT